MKYTIHISVSVSNIGTNYIMISTNLVKFDPLKRIF